MIAVVLLSLLLQTIPPPPPEGHTYQRGRAPAPVYNQSQSGMTAYFTSQAQDDYRAARIAALQSVPIEQRIAESLGVDVVPLGAQVSHDIAGTSDARITSHTMVYGTGAVSQFLVGIPESEARGLMVALHGCTGSPDRVMGLLPRDYTNDMGKLALDDGWIVIAPYIMSYCGFLDDYNALGDIVSNVDTMGYEMMKIHLQVQYVADLHNAAHMVFYGISYGGQIALYSGAYYDYYDAIVISGNMVRDYVPLHRSIILPIRNRHRTGTALDLRRYMTVDNLLDDFIEDGGTKIIIEAGTQDADIKKTLQYMASCDACELVYFVGKHETAPWFTLPKLNDVFASNKPSESTLLPLVRR